MSKITRNGGQIVAQKISSWILKSHSQNVDEQDDDDYTTS